MKEDLELLRDAHQQALVRQVLKRTKKLTPVARLVLARYASSERTTPEGTVMELAKDMAEDLGMTPTQFSRERKKLVIGGWLIEDTDVRLGSVSHYRINVDWEAPRPKRPEVGKVIQLRTTA